MPGDQGYFRFGRPAGSGLAKLVVSPSNEIAHRVLTGLVAGVPTPNPVFLVGAAGAGKSGLLAAFGHSFQARAGRPPALLDGADWLDRGPGPRPPSISIDLERRCAGAGCLILDHLEAVPPEPDGLHALWHVFNLFHGDGRPIVAAARAAPRELDNLDAHLRSRLAWGLVVTLAPPGEAARREILQHLAAERAMRLSPAVVELILTRLERDPATLERAVAAIDAFSLETGRRIDRRLARQVIEGPEFRPATPSPAS